MCQWHLLFKESDQTLSKTNWTCIVYRCQHSKRLSNFSTCNPYTLHNLHNYPIVVSQTICISILGRKKKPPFPCHPHPQKLKPAQLVEFLVATSFQIQTFWNGILESDPEYWWWWWWNPLLCSNPTKMWNFIEVCLITRPQQADVNVNIYTDQCQIELH